MAQHRVVIVGGGFAGLQLARDLKCPKTSITIIDRRNHHLFQPLLYQVATTVLATSEIAWPIRTLFRERKDISTLLGEVVGIDIAQRSVSLKGGHSVPYDTLVLATGARHAYFGRDEWEPFAPGLKALEDATTIRRRLLLAFEKAELEADPQRRKALLTFSIIGAGPTGVEMAGIIAQLAHKILVEEFRSIDTSSARILLIEAGPRVLPIFPPALSDYAAKSLTKMGVEVCTGRPVTACNEDGVTIGDEVVPSRTVIWAAGVQASKAAEWVGAQRDRAGRALVEPDLTVAGHPEVFIVGDTASVRTEDGSQVPGIAPAAKQQGRYVASVIKARRLQKPAPAPFRYRHLGNLATIGPSSAVIDFGKFRLKGSLAWWIWGLAHIYFLIGTRSRMAVALSWLWVFTTGHHSARLITQKETLKEEV
ncbi:NAD(P)/FAD-dependent oxidoreductase [Rhizobium bangladeshense]|uniref:NAD(P)/FAD-dependent oxidoreductase n=1 Tax=Rhizobium bangladeshense TaxID=1138189 RepID=UPI001C830A5B|nr:NAD(P)/FAD-dependent oxidoreductase [Rhizobium bangladeshense]MBX4901272.1 NAD(P)/FAD-dependent oxidoreductase [Rhizobium bangladeshense]MBX4915360.1 NAD(P)/FAD-dependent oxidoreductase [Rhizobium bangladeshense]MBX4922136.1 NAD(P)/FAD-dependent oxidoreductase [Rhizobium bangladeshense]MBY3599337.1 NAD(P)/FAD-dependent oxidoreductase [Rhizobium bangladeshense]